jgi:hypothetical protein
MFPLLCWSCLFCSRSLHSLLLYMTIKASPIKQHSFCSCILSNCSSIASNGYSKNLTPGLLSEAAYIIQRRGNMLYALRRRDLY